MHHPKRHLYAWFYVLASCTDQATRSIHLQALLGHSCQLLDDISPFDRRHIHTLILCTSQHTAHEPLCSQEQYARSMIAHNIYAYLELPKPSHSAKMTIKRIVFSTPATQHTIAINASFSAHT